MIIFDAAATDPHDIIIIGANNTIYGGNIILYRNYVSEIIMLCIYIFRQGKFGAHTASNGPSLMEESGWPSHSE